MNFKVCSLRSIIRGFLDRLFEASCLTSYGLVDLAQTGNAMRHTSVSSTSQRRVEPPLRPPSPAVWFLAFTKLQNSWKLHGWWNIRKGRSRTGPLIYLRNSYWYWILWPENRSQYEAPPVQLGLNSQAIFSEQSLTADVAVGKAAKTWRRKFCTKSATLTCASSLSSDSPESGAPPNTLFLSRRRRRVTGVWNIYVIFSGKLSYIACIRNTYQSLIRTLETSNTGQNIPVAADPRYKPSGWCVCSHCMRHTYVPLAAKWHVEKWSVNMHTW